MAQQNQQGPADQSQSQQQGNDPNREPGDEDLYNRDKQGNIFYDKNTETRRESQFHDATGAPVGNEPKVTQEDDQFEQKPQK